MRIAFAGTPELASFVLEGLISANHEIVAVYTQPDKHAGRGQHLHMSPVKELALKHEIPIEQPITLKNPDAASTLEKYHIDVMIVVAYGLILPKNILNLPRFGCINVHFSLLPRWRGAAPIQHAILAGEKETGITLMKMDAGLDTGDILAQTVWQIAKDETSASLYNKLAHHSAQFLVEKLEAITLHAQPLPQNHQLATLAPKITKEEAKIHWDEPAIALERKVRAYNSWPVAFTHIEGHMLRIWQSQVVPLPRATPPGTIVEHAENGIVVATKAGALLIEKAQLPGKKPMAFTEILKGHAALFQIGNRFES